MANPITIKIDQATRPPGVAGSSRTDMVVGQLVTLTDPANGAGTYLWELIVPPGSASVLVGAATSTATFTPDIEGTYLVFLTVDAVTSWTVGADGTRLTTQGGGAILHLRGTRNPGRGETKQFDSAFGWSTVMYEPIKDLDTLRSAVTGTLVHGEVLYVDSTPDFARLAPSTSGFFLKTQGAAANPVWASVLAGTHGTVGYVNASGLFVGLAPGTAGQLLQTNGIGAPTWVSPGASVTLDVAYDGGGSGAGRSITADSGAVTITNSAANNNNVLEITKSPAGAQSGSVLSVTANANATGTAVLITNAGSGLSLSVASGNVLLAGDLELDGALNHDGTTVGFFNTTPATQPVSAANLTNNVTSGGTDNVVDNFTDLIVYANDAAAIRNAIYQLARKLKQVNDGLRTLGLLS